MNILKRLLIGFVLIGALGVEAMRELLRDMIANLNGMYHVMTVNPGLLAPAAEG